MGTEMTLPKEVMEGVKKELEKVNTEEKTIKCPKKECGHINPKNRLTCEKCGTRLFDNHKSSEGKTGPSKKVEKVIAKKKKEKKETKAISKKKETTKQKKAEAGSKEKDQDEKKEYPPKGSVKEKLLKTIRKHLDGVTMPGIQKEMGIGYRLDSYTQEFEERKLIKSKREGIERVYIPLAA